ALGVIPVLAGDGKRRDDLTEALAQKMTASTRSVVGDWFRDKATELAKRMATDYLRARRDELTQGNVSGAADILYYQRRGDEIRKYLQDALQKAATNRPLVVVAHSLGGELLADVLAQHDAPQIDLLVTAGTQISLFYAVDGLGMLRPPDQKPPFAKWVNFYDRNDFLSYLAKPTFAGANVKDVPIDSGVPFPDAHGAYWHNDDVYKRIQTEWP